MLVERTNLQDVIKRDVIVNETSTCSKEGVIDKDVQKYEETNVDSEVAKTNDESDENERKVVECKLKPRRNPVRKREKPARYRDT